MATPTSPPENLLRPMKFPMKTLMGPGPSNCSPRVLHASSLPMLGHLHPEFTQIMDEVKEGIKYIFQTDNEWTLCVSGTGHAAMETAVCNVIEDGDKVLVFSNGVWGERFAEMADRHGADVVQITTRLGTTFSLDQIEKAIKENRPDIVFITHGESSGTTLQDIEGVGAICHKYKSVLIVDAVASCGGVPLFMDIWEIDILYTVSQKVLSAPPGTSPISFSARARNKVLSRKKKVRSYYFDMNHLANYWGCEKDARRYHHTGPISNIYALREGLARLAEEGLENSWTKHKQNVKMLYDGLDALCLKMFVTDKSDRLPCLTGIEVPEGINGKEVAEFVMKKYNIEITGGPGLLAGKMWRIGLMGYNCTTDNVNLVLKALRDGIEQIQNTTV